MYEKNHKKETLQLEPTALVVCLGARLLKVIEGLTC